MQRKPISNKSRKEVPRIRANVVVFDLGNTLVMDPFEEIVHAIASRVVELINKANTTTVNPEVVISAWTQANDDVDYPFASHFFQEEPIVQTFLKTLAVPGSERARISPQILTLYRTQLTEQWSNDTQTQETLRTTFEGLRNKGKKIAVLSNDREFSPRASLAWLGVTDFVSTIITSEELKIEKPDVRVFRETANRLNTSLDSMVYVGDDPLRDIEAPKKIGLRAILFVPSIKHRKNQSWRNYEGELRTPPDATIVELTELINIIA